jgi:hypothetical protein
MFNARAKGNLFGFKSYNLQRGILLPESSGSVVCSSDNTAGGVKANANA